MTTFVSIGPYCITADILKKYNLRSVAYPFDYIFSSLEMVSHCLRDNFDIFLDKQYHKESIHSPVASVHTYYNNFLTTPLLKQHLHGRKDKSLFLHHNIKDENIYQSFKRRAHRLLNLVKSNKKVVFVYYNCYTTSCEDLINFYKIFFDKTNIFILGIYENNNKKEILYEHDRCKIYQNYDTKHILHETMSIFRDGNIKCPFCNAFIE